MLFEKYKFPHWLNFMWFKRHNTIHYRLKVSGLTMSSFCSLFRRLISPRNDVDSASSVVKKRCNEIEPGSKFVRVHTFNAKDSTTVVTNYYQVGFLRLLVGKSNNGQRLIGQLAIQTLIMCAQGWLTIACLKLHGPDLSMHHSTTMEA